MGQLVNGVWHDTWYDTTKSGGAFERSTAKFRSFHCKVFLISALIPARFPNFCIYTCREV